MIIDSILWFAWCGYLGWTPPTVMPGYTDKGRKLIIGVLFILLVQAIGVGIRIITVKISPYYGILVPAAFFCLWYPCKERVGEKLERIASPRRSS